MKLNQPFPFFLFFFLSSQGQYNTIPYVDPALTPRSEIRDQRVFAFFGLVGTGVVFGIMFFAPSQNQNPYVHEKITPMQENVPK